MKQRIRCYRRALPGKTRVNLGLSPPVAALGIIGQVASCLFIHKGTFIDYPALVGVPELSKAELREILVSINPPYGYGTYEIDRGEFTIFCL